MKTDIQISRECNMLHIEEIASGLGLDKNDIELYGKYKAKIDVSKINNDKNGKLILVTAINPTPAGEGKTTVNVGLSMGLNKIGKNAISALREPSLGPVFGIKGGATGGGYSQVVPMDDINLHFTGDIHAITSANNLISAVIDNHIFFGNELKFDLNRVVWKRCIDLNDRSLRVVNVSIDGKKNTEINRTDGFDISVASEIMAILCLSDDISDLKKRVARIVVGYDIEGNEIKAEQLEIVEAVCILLKDAIKPNLVQTLENTPVIMHGGPFANIAHGCNSIIATKTALKLADYVVTESGFGADLGAEKFMDIKCRYADIKPDAVVIVATIRALKMNGGVSKDNLDEENIEALKNGWVNLEKHIENINKFGMNPIVAINMFPSDTEEEHQTLLSLCKNKGVVAVKTNVWSEGGDGAINLAKEVVKFIDENNNDEFKFLYDLDDSIENKINIIAKEVYGADNVVFNKIAREKLETIKQFGYDKLPVCIAKTQYSFSDNPKLLGRPSGFDITVKNLVINAGAGFIVVIIGNIVRMPGLPKVPTASLMTIDENGIINGLS